MTLPVIDGNTPVDEEQRIGLRASYITTRSELDTAEQAGIAEAIVWARRATAMRFPNLLSPSSVLKLHKIMFGSVYDWAGTMRRRETSIGVDPSQISGLLRQTCDNARFWVDNATWQPVETVVRLHHDLARIHVFPNGNGRHARLMADLLLLRHYEQKPLTWGGPGLRAQGEVHTAYITAMRSADAGDFTPLLDFANSSGHMP
jgi:Fic-DOC domain mobile mystery protein B